MKVRSKKLYSATEITAEMISGTGQATIRKMVGAVTAVEVFPGRVVCHTRKNRYSMAINQWFIRDDAGKIEILTDQEFKRDFEIVNE
jgi:hypothetical protein